MSPYRMNRTEFEGKGDGEIAARVGTRKAGGSADPDIGPAMESIVRDNLRCQPAPSLYDYFQLEKINEESDRGRCERVAHGCAVSGHGPGADSRETLL
jgi:hypothetical protein